MGLGLVGGNGTGDVASEGWRAGGSRLECEATRGKPGSRSAGARACRNLSILQEEQRFGKQTEAGGRGTKGTLSSLLFPSSDCFCHTWGPPEPHAQLSGSCRLAVQHPVLSCVPFISFLHQPPPSFRALSSPAPDPTTFLPCWHQESEHPFLPFVFWLCIQTSALKSWCSEPSAVWFSTKKRRASLNRGYGSSLAWGWRSSAL